MNTVSKNLVSTVIYRTYAHSVWEDLKERFDKVNTSRTFYLHKEIETLTQGVSFVSIYFSRLRELWDELEALTPPSLCPCPESKQYSEHFQLHRLWQFFVDINKSFDNARSQILITVPLPSVNQAYTMIINVESQRKNVMIEENNDSAALINKMPYNHGISSSSFSSKFDYSDRSSGPTNNSHTSGFTNQNISIIMTSNLGPTMKNLVWSVSTVSSKSIPRMHITNFMDIQQITNLERKEEILLVMAIVS